MHCKAQSGRVYRTYDAVGYSSCRQNGRSCMPFDACRASAVALVHAAFVHATAWLLGGSVVRALDSGPIGREFESRRLRFRVTRSTQPSIPSCMAGVKAGRAHLCRVAGNTV